MWNIKLNRDEYYNFGTATFAWNYRHYRFTPEVFYQFKNIMDTYSLISDVAVQHDNSFILHPNPARHKTILAFYNPLNKKIHCKVFDINGRQILLKLSITQNRIIIEKGATPAGVYLIHLYEDKELKFISRS